MRQQHSAQRGDMEKMQHLEQSQCTDIVQLLRTRLAVQSWTLCNDGLPELRR